MKNNARHLMLSALAMLSLAGCGKPPEPSASTPTPASSPGSSPAAAAATPAPQAEEKKLNIFCWSEYIPQDVIDAFSKETGIQVSVENYASNEEMLAKLLAGGGSYDLIQPSEYAIEGLIAENLLVPIDHALIPNLKNIAPEFLNMSFDPGNKYTVPYMAGTVGIVVNTELVKDEITGFNDVFQDKYKKNIVVLDDAREIVTWAMLSQGIPVNDVTDENLEKVKPTVAKWVQLVKVYDSDSPKTALLNGDVALGVVWGGEGALLLNADKKFKWVMPKEGTHLFIDSLAIPKIAKHPTNAQQFMNFILRPDISVKMSDAFPYLNPNAAARPLLTKEQQENPASFPSAEQISKMQTFKDIGGQATKVDELVTSLKAE
ncbi:MAG: spermidine/putrescine ABC transporter substrate-binding protein [Verrucomicrobia bacterium]|nr:spermidine/putrescine ABC transporter substrate-binding protein [Verrucomicrobiota bacterium]